MSRLLPHIESIVRWEVRVDRPGPEVGELDASGFAESIRTRVGPSELGGSRGHLHPSVVCEKYRVHCPVISLTSFTSSSYDSYESIRQRCPPESAPRPTKEPPVKTPSQGRSLAIVARPVVGRGVKFQCMCAGGEQLPGTGWVGGT